MAYSPLRDQLIFAQKTSGFDSRQPFVPAGKLREIMTESAIKGELRANLGRTEQVDQVEIDSIQDFITGRARPAIRIFATLVYSRQTNKIRDFLDCNIDDGKLPIKIGEEFFKIPDNEVISDIKRYFNDQTIFFSWRDVELLEFYNNQWRFNAPIFHRQTSNPKFPHFPEQTILPFDVEGRPKGTPFSKVWKIKIHADHVGGSKAMDRVMALKESTQNIDHVREQVQASANEIETLEKINQNLSSKVLVGMRVSSEDFRPFLTMLNTAFYRGDKSYMLLPWADGGSLYDLWYRGKHQVQDISVEWVRFQTQGLITGLFLLHEAECCHGDLKPDNILVFRSEKPKLKAFPWELSIADFGLARVFEHATHSRKHTRLMSGAQRYEPPEADREVNKPHPDNDKPRSRQYDIWSLGCIFLEFIIWKCFGKEGLKEFNQELGDRRVEKFWKRDANRSYIVHPVVECWIRETRDQIKTMDIEDKKFLFFLLDQVENGMLRIEVSDDRAGNTENYRRTAGDLFDESNQYYQDILS